MGLSQSILDKLFPGNTGITQYFSPQGQLGYQESGIDIGYGPHGAGVPVNLVSSGIYAGAASGGYVDVFKSDVSGLYEYYQHIVSTPGLVQGQDYPAGTQIGTIAPVSGTPAGYSTTGPHLEFGIASGPALNNPQYPNYANIDPIPVIQTDVVRQQDKGTWLTNNPITNFFGAAGNAIGQDVQRSTQDFTNPGQASHDLFGTSTNPVQDAVTGLFQNLGIGKYIVLGFLGIGAIVLVYALIRGGDGK